MDSNCTIIHKHDEILSLGNLEVKIINSVQRFCPLWRPDVEPTVEDYYIPSGPKLQPCDAQVDQFIEMNFGIQCSVDYVKDFLRCKYGINPDNMSRDDYVLFLVALTCFIIGKSDKDAYVSFTDDTTWKGMYRMNLYLDVYRKMFGKEACVSHIVGKNEHRLRREPPKLEVVKSVNRQFTREERNNLLKTAGIYFVPRGMCFNSETNQFDLPLSETLNEKERLVQIRVKSKKYGFNFR
jgi:hypothetical protein